MDSTTLRFPGEVERSAEVQGTLHDEFDLADSLYAFWLRQPKDSWLDQSKLPATVTNMAMLLNMQACRQFRTIIDECKRSEAINGSILARSLFETILALFFMLKPIVRIETKAIRKKTGGPKFDNYGNPEFAATPGSKKRAMPKPLTRDFRAALYVAHTIFEDQELARVSSATAGRKRFGRMYRKKLSATIIQNAEKRIGAEWTSILRAGHGYSGLSIYDLAKLLDKRQFEFWYRTVYHLQSRVVHSTGASTLSCVLENGALSAKVFSDDQDVRFVIYAATAVMLFGMSKMQQYIELGNDTEQQLNRFIERHKRTYGALV